MIIFIPRLSWGFSFQIDMFCKVSSGLQRQVRVCVWHEGCTHRHAIAWLVCQQAGHRYDCYANRSCCCCCHHHHYHSPRDTSKWQRGQKSDCSEIPDTRLTSATADVPLQLDQLSSQSWGNSAWTLHSSLQGVLSFWLLSRWFYLSPCSPENWKVAVLFRLIFLRS